MGGDRATTTALRPGYIWLIAVLASLALGACSQQSAAADVPEDECFLGLDLWDTDPALTWIEDGRVWVRAGDHQACLSATDATELLWGPDGRHVLLDGGVFRAGAETLLATVPTESDVVWQQPLGPGLYAIPDTGSIQAIGVDTVLPGDAVNVASHPDAEHMAVVLASGRVDLIDSDGGLVAELLQLRPGQRVAQIEFAADGSRLWVLVDEGGSAEALFIDLLPLSGSLYIEPVESIVPLMAPPPPDLYYVDQVLAAADPDLTIGVGAAGADITRFALHPAHNNWIAITQGRCESATSSLYLDGELSADQMPGRVVGFYRGHGLPVLATTTAGGGCGSGSLWVVEDLPRLATSTLIAEDVSSTDIRDEAPDPWNPDTAPPFA